MIVQAELPYYQCCVVNHVCWINSINLIFNLNIYIKYTFIRTPNISLTGIPVEDKH